MRSEFVRTSPKPMEQDQFSPGLPRHHPRPCQEKNAAASGGVSEYLLLLGMFLFCPINTASVRFAGSSTAMDGCAIVDPVTLSANPLLCNPVKCSGLTIPPRKHCLRGTKLTWHWHPTIILNWVTDSANLLLRNHGQMQRMDYSPREVLFTKHPIDLAPDTNDSSEASP